MHLVVIIPCFNEEPTVGKVVGAVPRKVEGIARTDVVVVDDGSTDGTAEAARRAGARVVSHPDNRGVGVAFNTGIDEAIRLGADVTVNMDGDGQFDPADIPVLIRPILEGKADFVTASRFKDKSLIPSMPGVKKWGNRRMAELISLLVGRRFHDVSCGFRAYSRETILNLNLFGRFTYTQETFLDLAFRGTRIVETPLRIRGEREFGESRVASSLWRYAVNSAKIVFRTFRDYKPLRFFGFVSAALFLVALLLGGFFFIRYFMTGRFSGHLWAGFVAGFCLTQSTLFFATGLLADMFDRIRRNQEKLVYFERRRLMECSDRVPDKDGSS